MELCSKKSQHFGKEYEIGNVSNAYDTDNDEIERYLGKPLDTTNPHNLLDFFRKNKKWSFRS